MAFKFLLKFSLEMSTENQNMKECIFVTMVKFIQSVENEGVREIRSFQNWEMIL